MRITLFFTYDISLKTWAETGLLQREIRLYQELQKLGIVVQFLTYGGQSDRQWEPELGGIKLIPVYEYLPRPNSKILRLLQSFSFPGYSARNYIEVISSRQTKFGVVG